MLIFPKVTGRSYTADVTLNHLDFCEEGDPFPYCPRVEGVGTSILFVAYDPEPSIYGRIWVDPDGNLHASKLESGIQDHLDKMDVKYVVDAFPWIKGDNRWFAWFEIVEHYGEYRWLKPQSDTSNLTSLLPGERYPEKFITAHIQRNRV